MSEQTARQRRAPSTDVLLCPGGPMLVRGHQRVLDDEGEEHVTTRPVSAVCRCGHSASAPWCDGTHKVARARPSVVRALDEPVERRSVDFGGLDISYDQRVLEPRRWTVGQARWAASLLSGLPPGPVLELCAGAGQIGLLAVRDQPRHLVMVDVDRVACDYARLNAETAGLGERVTVRCGRLQDVVESEERFALVVADPPWVPTHEVGAFPEDPRRAIDGGPGGLDLVRDCLEVVSSHLAPRGAAVLQVGPDGQAAAVRDHLSSRPDLGLTTVGCRWHARGTVVLLRHRGRGR